MKKVNFLILSCILVFAVSSCDFMRSIAGRPTSSKLAIMKECMERTEAEKALRDSLRMELAAAEALVADSVKCQDAPVQDPDADAARLKIAAGEVTLKQARNLSAAACSSLHNSFYIILGSFMDQSNARRLSDMVAAAGYESLMFNLANGLTVVAACPTDIVSQAVSSYERIRAEKFCPPDVWIMEKSR